ncbi:hypothetical protein ASC90_23815 [Rhizobium sp. Root1220]|nr:hypothetical protein ASC90_23815 [Rhizobium sp. Root1220]
MKRPTVDPREPQPSEEDGTNSNGIIESFFRRVEKAYKGINHGFWTSTLHGKAAVEGGHAMHGPARAVRRLQT